MKTRQSIQPLCFYYRQMRERQDFGQLLCSQGQSKLQRTRCMPELILCCLSLTFVTVQSSSRYRSAEWPSALMIRLSGSYLGKHWRTLGNCFYDSGSPLWADPSGKQQSSQRARTCKSFQTWPFPFSPTVHKISSEKFKKVHKAYETKNEVNRTSGELKTLHNLFSSCLFCSSATRSGLSPGSRLPLYEPPMSHKQGETELPTLLLFHRLSSSKGNRRASVSSWENPS